MILYYDLLLSASFYLLFVSTFHEEGIFLWREKVLYAKFIIKTKKSGREKPRCLTEDTELSKPETQSN